LLWESFLILSKNCVTSNAALLLRRVYGRGAPGLWLMQVTERYKQRVLPEKRAYFSTNERPDVWFEPSEVWEIRGADLTLSAVHKSAFGLLHPTRGVSLRQAFVNAA
jgi:ATP-dependent DNA ligase